MSTHPPLQGIPGVFRKRMVALVVASLGGCAGMPPPILPPREPTAMGLAANGLTAPLAAPAPAASAASAAQPAAATGGTPRLFQTPPPPRAPSKSAVPTPAGTPVPEDPALETAVSLTQLPMPVFIDTVFATILKRNLSVDASIAQRREFVSLKSGKPQSASQLYEAAKSVLKSYGIAVTEYNGLVRVTPSAGSTGFVPEVRRGRSSPDVPAALRPVFQIVDLESVSPTSVVGWLRTIFGQRLSIQDDLGNQAILLSGQSDDIAAALETIRVLDQPTMRGRSSARIAPLFWSADELAKRLAEIMQAQGYSVGTTAQAQAPIILLPVPPLNSVLVFARSDEVLNHVLRWATDLDKPASGRGSAGYFTYAVRNLDAADLAKTLQEVMNPAAAAGGAVAAGGVRSRVVVNASSNTLIIQGSPTEYQQWFGLLQELDRPPRSALVSVTIAEVRLTDGQQLGFEWLLNEFKLGNFIVNMSTLGAFGTAAIGGLSAVITGTGDNSARVIINALASTSRVRVLANPTVMARNGEPAYIQVGSEVPVVTSQQTTGNVGLQPGLLQTIQYRSTGVILKVKPVIHAGGRIDLDVEQEVSRADSTKTGVSASPTISTRKITTKLSVVDGATVVLGGLMQESASNSDTGVPFLKDLPLAGALFRSTDTNRERTELVMLITPYVIADEFEARAITDAFRQQFPFDLSTPTQVLRPERSVAPASAPRGAIQDPSALPKPYVVPPADAPAADPPGGSRDLRSAPAAGGVTRPDFGSAPAGPSTANSPATAASSTSGPVAPGAVPGAPVTDPQLLKELQNAIKPK